MANRSYLKSQKLKATEADRQKIALLEAENAALKKDKAALEQRVRMLKEVIQKNRGNLLICILRFSNWSCECIRPFGRVSAYVLFVVIAEAPEGVAGASGGGPDCGRIRRFHRGI